MFNPFLGIYVSKPLSARYDWRHSRIGKDVHGDFLPVLVQGFLDVESPEKSCYGQQGALFSQTLTTANPSAPPKGHVPLVVGERTMEWMAFRESVWAKAVGVREIVLVSMNGPNIALDPGVFGDVPTLQMSEQDNLARSSPGASLTL